MKNIEKIKRREEAELEKRTKLRAKPKFMGFMVFLFLIIALTHILDGYVTDAPAALQSAIVNEFYVNGLGLSFETGLSQYSLLSTAFIVVAVFATLFKAQSDRFGRKPILLISIVGMTVGMFILFIAKDLTLHIIGRAIIAFFVATDVQVVYVLECAPPQKRATWYAGTKFLAMFGAVFISLARGANTVNGIIQWRNVFSIPLIVGIALVFFAFIFMRETDTFLDNRIKELSTPYDERIAAKKKDKKKTSGNIVNAFKYIFKNKQPRSIIITNIFSFMAVMAFFGYYESIMMTSGMATENITKAIFAYPFTGAFITLIAGWISDKIGRKRGILLYGLVAVISLITFVVLARNNANAYIVGLAFGLAIGGYWTFGDTIGISLAESSPTEIRSSVIAASGLIQVVSAAISAIVIAVMINFVDLGILCSGYGAILVGIGITYFMINVKETKGIDLEGVDFADTAKEK